MQSEIISRPSTASPSRTRIRTVGLASHRLERVLHCMEARLAEPILLQELAAEIDMSPFHFARMFKLSTGRSPHAYLTVQRMERAKRLLSESPLSLAEVANRIGYQTQAHFTGVFHRQVGTTPKVYRDRHRVQAASTEPSQVIRV